MPIPVDYYPSTNLDNGNVGYAAFSCHVSRETTDETALADVAVAVDHHL